MTRKLPYTLAASIARLDEGQFNHLVHLMTKASIAHEKAKAAEDGPSYGHVANTRGEADRQEFILGLELVSLLAEAEDIA
jgi:hypothetical protein